jgi:hypothetical protein
VSGIFSQLPFIFREKGEVGMTIHRERRIVYGAIVLTLAAVVVLFAPSWADDSVYSSGLLELGDGVPPPGMPGMADITANPDQSGPDWAEIFDADGSARDDYPLDGEGNAQGNGVPDYQELYGGQWAVFTADYVSMGSGFEGDALTADGAVANGVVQADNDLGNAYVYSTFDGAGNLVIFAGAERLGSGDSSLEFEFNQDKFRLGHGVSGPPALWHIVGSRAEGDILVSLEFSGGGLGAVSTSVWTGSSWTLLSDIPGEGCDVAETLCAVTNYQTIEGGSWDGQTIGAGQFVEMGLNIGALTSGAQPIFTTVRLRTPEDAAFGYFGEGSGS